MILFAADNHFGKHCGRVLHDQIATRFPIDFYEDDWSCFLDDELATHYELLILNMIEGSSGVETPSAEAAANVLAFLEEGKPLLLLHGASAAFWQSDWWRPIVGHRWVRGNDPDGVPASTHPVRPYDLDVAKSRHPLAASLTPIKVPEDEIYIHLEQTCPTEVLMTTKTVEGTFPQCYAAETPWGGQLLSYIPGHRPEVVSHPDMVANCCTLIDYLLKENA